jgi:hypothetical protein
MNALTIIWTSARFALTAVSRIAAENYFSDLSNKPWKIRLSSGEPESEKIKQTGR